MKQMKSQDNITISSSKKRNNRLRILIFILVFLIGFLLSSFLKKESKVEIDQKIEIVVIKDDFKVDDRAILKLTGEEVILVSKSWNYPRMWWVRTTYKDVKNSLISENEDGLIKKNN
jgi:hypothetical protein